MIDLTPLNLSAVLLLSGLLGYVLVSQLIGFVAKTTRKDRNNIPPKIPLHLPNHSDAYFLVEPGGIISYSNPTVRDMFGLNGGKANLEVIAEEIRPNESFFALCTREGKARFNLGDRLIEGKSYVIPFNSNEAMLVSFRSLDFEDITPERTTSPAPQLSQHSRKEELRTVDRDEAVGINFGIKDSGHNSMVLTQELENSAQDSTRELRLEHQRTETLLRIMTELSSSLDFERILQRTLEVLNEVIGARHATCMVLQPGNKQLRHLAHLKS